QRAMDEWCAVWFWPTDAELLKHVPTPLNFHKPLEERAAIIERVASEGKFFHWELAFPDVITVQRTGFDALIGNPPWDVVKPNSHEFFSDFEPLYRTLDKQTAHRKQKELFTTLPTVADQWSEYNARFKALGNWIRNTSDPFSLTLSRGKAGTVLAASWAAYR